MIIEPNKVIYFIITRRCNYHCSFCIRKNLERRGQDMSLVKAQQVLKKIQEALPNTVLVITGGEPLLHPDCEEFIRYSTKLFNKVLLTTNGSFAVQEREMLRPYLKKNLWIQFSLDGTELTHDSIRGKGAYKKTTENINKLNDVSEHILISSTFGIGNYRGAPELAKALNSFSFYRWKISMEIVQDPLNDKMIDISSWNNMVDLLLPLCHFRVRIQKYYDFRLMDNFLNKYDPIKHKIITKCGSGLTTFVINPDFSATPCTCMNENIGNFYNDDTISLLEKLETHCQLPPTRESICYECKYSSICNGGCPGYSMKCFGQYNMGDIRCPLVKQHYKS